MGRISDFFTGSTPVEELATQKTPAFDLSPTTIDTLLFGAQTSSYVAPVAKVDRKSAMSVPAVQGARKRICEGLGSLPIDFIGPDKKPVTNTLLDQPENGIPRSVTMTYTVEDLLFHGVAWWKINEFAWTTYPSKVQRVDPSTVTVQDDGTVYMSGVRVAPDKFIRFYSPNDGLLVSGARAIRACLALDAAAARFADGVPPVDYFTPRDGIVDPEVEDVQADLDAWQAARRVRSTGFVSGDLEYKIAGWNPEQLQMAAARSFAITEIARLTGLDGEDLNVSTTSRTYFNAFDRDKAFIDYVLGPYRQAIEDRLSMNDVTPRGYVAKFNLSAFLRSDEKSRFETHAIALSNGFKTLDEVRASEDLPALSAPVAAPIKEVAA